MAVFGLAAMGPRTVGSYLHEFESNDPDLLDGRGSVKQIVESLRAFFMNVYRQDVVPSVEQAMDSKFDDIPDDKKPAVGFLVGGFSESAHLSEVWVTVIPKDDTPNSAHEVRAQGSFGTNWFATYEPIRRYVKGVDPALLAEVIQYFEGVRGQPLTEAERAEVEAIAARYEYQIPFAAMPLQEGIDHTKFLVELVVNHHRYAVGAPVVGGRVRVGAVTYRGEFDILDS